MRHANRHPIRSSLRRSRVVASRVGPFRGRRGSVLILVVALVVLLALMGTAYLSSTSTERASSVQHINNTEGDIQGQGMASAVVASLGGQVYGNGASGPVYRPPSQEMPTYDGTGQYTSAGTKSPTTIVAGTPGYPEPSGYSGGESAATDPLLGSRVPEHDLNNVGPVWQAVAFPPFVNAAGTVTIGSPVEGTTTTLPMAFKPYLKFYPTSKTVNGAIYPAAVLYLSGVPTAVAQANPTYNAGPGYVSPNVPGGFVSAGPPSAFSIQANAQYAMVAADTDGDGIADALYFPMPTAPVAGVTYYAACRVIDGNSAVNVSTAWTSGLDRQASDTSTTARSPGDDLLNYGFFRSNVGLEELLNAGNAAYTPNLKLNSLNYLRFANTNGPYAMTPTTDAGGTEDFTFFTAGDALEHEMARRPGYAGPIGNGTSNTFQWIGPEITATFAHQFLVQDATQTPSLVEQSLPDDTMNRYYVGSTLYTPNVNVRLSPYAATDALPWYAQQFNYTAAYGPFTSGTSTTPLSILSTNAAAMPLRPLLVGNNAVSNAISSRLGNLSGPPVWTSGVAYKFGDWVVDGGGRSYVCILPHTSANTTEPGGGVSPMATPFWAGTQAYSQPVYPGLPFTRQPVKVSMNTAPFDQLWLGFAQAMCDSVGPDAAVAGGPTPQATAVAQWQPPMQAAPVPVPAKDVVVEQQMPMFRSPIRDPLGTARTTYRLTSSQVLKLRAALAAVNAMDGRDNDDDVTSRRIFLTDGANTPVYDAEVFGTEAQPFIGAVYAHIDVATAANDFLAIQLVNPYDHAITLNPTDGWRLGTVDRTKFPTMTMTDLTSTVGWTTAVTIPAKSTITGLPGVAVIQSGMPPVGYSAPVASPGSASTTIVPLQPPTAATVTITQLQLALSTNAGELYLMKPRLQRNSGTAPVTATSVTSKRINTSTGTFGEAYDETVGTGTIGDLVPVDQVDLSNLTALATAKPNTTTNTADFYYRRGADSTTAEALAAPPTGALTGGRAGWHFVYPGPYVAPTSTTLYATMLPQGFGSDYNSMSAAPSMTNPVLGQLAGYGTVGVPDLTGTGQPSAPTYLTFPIVLNNTFMAGISRLKPMLAAGVYAGSVPAYPATPQWPFGGFARNVDLLQVPFIGAYRIRRVDSTGALVDGATAFVEMNSVSADSSLANDTTLGPPAPQTQSVASALQSSVTDQANSPLKEQIGRFCPVGDTTVATNVPAVPTAGDFGSASANWHYHWAKRVLSYFTVQAPNDDYFPNVDPAPSDTGISITGATYGPPAKYAPLNAPVAVSNNAPRVANSQTAGTSEDTVGVEGKININTAPWPVLATIPFFAPPTVASGIPQPVDYITYTQATAGNPTGTATTNVTPLLGTYTDDRIDLAKAIVDYRNANGPFKSIADLYNVPAFRMVNDAMVASAEPGYKQGLFSPAGFGINASTAPTGRPRYDFEERFLLLNQISNLITTRSDTFTCYVLVQGYRNVNTPGVVPTLAVQRTAAFLLDRTGVTPVNASPSRYPVPNN